MSRSEQPASPAADDNSPDLQEGQAGREKAAGESFEPYAHVGVQPEATHIRNKQNKDTRSIYLCSAFSRFSRIKKIKALAMHCSVQAFTEHGGM